VRLKYRLKRFRYVCSWKYPKLYRGLRFAWFPAQILALCALMAAMVSYYQAHYSFEATARASAAASTTDDSRLLSANNAALKNEPRLYVAAYAERKQIDDSDTIPAPMAAENTAEVPTESTNPTDPAEIVHAALPKKSNPDKAAETPAKEILSLTTLAEKKEAHEALVAMLLKSEELRNRKLQKNKRIEVPTVRVASLPGSSEANANRAAESLKVYSEQWLQAQPSSHYVVQIASSTNHELLAEFAKNNPLNGPLAIYRSSVSERGNEVYGLSTGLFSSRADAMAELPKLAEASKRHGVWVRKVSAVQEKLTSLKRDRLIQ